jgi:hypothetical protein
LYLVDAKWKTIPSQIPDDAMEVTVRFALGFSPPVRATWNEGGQAFTNVKYWDPALVEWVDSGLVFPWFVLNNWKLI